MCGALGTMFRRQRASILLWTIDNVLSLQHFVLYAQ